MRKFFRGVVTGIMLLAMSSTAFATEPVSGTAMINVNGGSQQIPVMGSYVGESTEIVYSVEVEWTPMNFTYTAPSKGTWNPEKHEYTNPDSSQEGIWSEPATITITNHSNSEIHAALSYESERSVQGVVVKFNEPSVSIDYHDVLNTEIASADNGADGQAGAEQSKSFRVRPFGELPKIISYKTPEDTPIGTITVTITGKE